MENLIKSHSENVPILSGSIDAHINRWKKITEEITLRWIAEYFQIEDNEDIDHWWISNDIGGIFQFGDYFISFNDVLDCYKHKISLDDFFKWYNYSIENQNINIRLATFVLLPQQKKEKEKAYLEELKNKCKFAEEELKKALDELDPANIKL